MTPRESLWTRIGQWINPQDNALAVPGLAKSDTLLLDSPDMRRSAPRSLGWSRRDTLAQDHARVIDLVETIQRHLERQDGRSEQVVHSLTDLATALRSLPSATTDQATAMSRVAAQMEIANSQTQGVLGVLSAWPDATAAQKETLDSIAVQMQASSAATVDLTQRLRALDNTVGTLGAATHEQIRTLQCLQHSQQEQDAQLVSVLASQTRRFTMLFVLALVLALVALVAAGLSLFS